VHPGYRIGRDYEGLDDAHHGRADREAHGADIERLAEVLSDVLAEVPA
jgi:hypothetical protein